MTMKNNRLTMAVIALSLTQAVSAAEPFMEKEADNTNTYWGVGIGSVLGAVIAGPPGAAIGGTLGASIGWGKDQVDARDEDQEEALQQTLALQHQQLTLESKLQQAEQELRGLKRKHSEQLSHLKALQAQQDDKSKETAFLEKLVNHYTQDIYFRIGQSAAPDGSQERLSNLVALLNAYPDLQVTLKGYTDPSGSAKLNAALAQARVDSIKQLLQAQGIDESRIIGLAIGEVTQQQVADAGGIDTQSIDKQNGLLEPSTQAADSQEQLLTHPYKARNPVLDRRVAIALSVREAMLQNAGTDVNEGQTNASLASLGVEKP